MVTITTSVRRRAIAVLLSVAILAAITAAVAVTAADSGQEAIPASAEAGGEAVVFGPGGNYEGEWTFEPVRLPHNFADGIVVCLAFPFCPAPTHEPYQWLVPNFS